MMLAGFSLNAQLEDGSVAPDFTINDIDGNEHHLYAYLDSGYSVIVDFSATWCGPCWSYHNSGVFEELYETYGPDGTNEVRILMIEADDSTTDADLHGTGTSTWGDWTAGVEYPIIDNGGVIFDAYECNYYPTIFTICPNRLLHQTGQASVSGHAGYFQSGSCAPASLPLDVGLISYTGTNRSCPNTPTPLSVQVINNGTEPLTSFTLSATTLFGVDLLTYEWSGYLETYEMEEVNMGEAIFPSTSMFFIEVISEDGYAGNNSVSETMNLATETATSLVRVRFTTDNMPGDNRWSITDGNGDEVAGIAFGEMTQAQTEYIWWVNVEELGCYLFNVYDLVGNGGNIECDISTFNAGGENINNIFTVNNSGNWNHLNKGFLVNEINTSVESFDARPPLSIYPNPIENNSLTLTGLENGNVVIQIHSITGVMAWDSQQTVQGGVLNLNVSNLAPGMYVVSAQDAIQTQNAQFVKK